MASTVTRKHPRQRHKVADMTTDELQKMIERVIERKLSEWAGDPRIARRRAEIAANTQATREEYRKDHVRRGTVQTLVQDLQR